MNKFTVRNAVKADAAACYQLIIDLAIYEKEPEAVSNTLEQFKEDGFGENPIYQLKVAESNEGEILGMALFFTAYSTWKGKMLYLDDLVVKEGCRRDGIGSSLIAALIEHAQDNGVKVVKWQVLDWNEPAIELYKKLNMKLDEGWIDCKLYEDQIKSFSKPI